MTTRRLAALLFAVLPAAAAAAQDPPPPQLLRLGFAVGKTQYYSLSTSRQTSVDQGGRKIEAAMDLELVLSAKVAAVKDGVADVAFTVHRVAVKLDGPNKADYDSDVGGEVPAAARRAVETFAGPFHVSIDDRGHATGFELPRRDTGGMVLVEHSALESCLLQALPELPEQPLAPGGSWETGITAQAGMLAGDKIHVTNKLVGIEAGKAAIEQQLAFDPSSTKLAGGGSKAAETFRGASVIDLATGLLCSADLELVVNLQGKAGGGPTLVKTVTTTKLRAISAPAPKPAAPQQPGR